MSQSIAVSALTIPAPGKGDVALRKKKGHDLAYLLIILAVLFGAFLFTMIVVNSMLGNFGI